MSGVLNGGQGGGGGGGFFMKIVTKLTLVVSDLGKMNIYQLVLDP